MILTGADSQYQHYTLYLPPAHCLLQLTLTCITFCEPCVNWSFPRSGNCSRSMCVNRDRSAASTVPSSMVMDQHLGKRGGWVFVQPAGNWLPRPAPQLTRIDQCGHIATPFILPASMRLSKRNSAILQFTFDSISSFRPHLSSMQPVY